MWQRWSYEPRAVDEAREEVIGGGFSANCQVVPCPPNAENSAGSVFVHQRNLGSDFAPLRGNDKLLLIHGSLRNQRKLAVATG